MELPSEGLGERLREIEAYLAFLRTVEKATTSGPPRLIGADSPITAEQQRILYASVYLQLYSVVEATITRCLDYVTIAALTTKQPQPGQLSNKLRRAWVQEIARTHIDLTPQHRLESALMLCNHLVEQLPVTSFRITKGAGNWDDTEIEDISKRIGCPLTVPQDAYKAAKRPFSNNKNALTLIKSFRNQLAHGEISFAECGAGVIVEQLERLTGTTAAYLQGVAASFESYVAADGFLRVVEPEAAAA